LVGVNVTVTGNTVQAEIDLIESDIRELKKEVLTGLASIISEKSPVDSGTYAVSHEVSAGSGITGGTRSRSPNAKRVSKGGVAQYPNAKQQGFQNMIGAINSISMDSNSFVISNPMDYAALIEAGVYGLKTGGKPPPYASAIREAPSIIERVAQQIAARNR
jgi:hypothetical protein